MQNLQNELNANNNIHMEIAAEEKEKGILLVIIF